MGVICLFALLQHATYDVAIFFWFPIFLLEDLGTIPFLCFLFVPFGCLLCFNIRFTKHPETVSRLNFDMCCNFCLVWAKKHCVTL